MLFLLVGAGQECSHHVVALGGHRIASSLLLLLLLFIIFLGFFLEFFHFLLCYGGGRDFLLSWLWLLVLLDVHNEFLGSLLFRFWDFLFGFWYIVFLLFGDDLELLTGLGQLLFLFLELLLA